MTMKLQKKVLSILAVLLIIPFCLAVNDAHNILYGEQMTYAALTKKETKAFFSGEKLQKVIEKKAENLSSDSKKWHEGWSEATEYLSEQVPELDRIGTYIDKKSEGRARFTMGFATEAEELYDGYGNFLGIYYGIYIGEQWEDHRANWHWFFVNNEMDEILWMDIVNIDYYTLEEWRNMDSYKEQMQEIEEFLGN